MLFDHQCHGYINNVILFVFSDGRTAKTFFGDVIVTHVRASTFLIGMAVGYLILKIKEGQITLKMSKVSDIELK